MFNYVGQIREPTFERMQRDIRERGIQSGSPETASLQVIDEGSSDYGLLLFDVEVPAASSYEIIVAAVLTVPGMLLDYQPGDIVVIGELEQADDGAIHYFILGRLQHRSETSEIRTRTISQLNAESGTLKSGSVLGDVALVNTSNVQADILPQSQGTLTLTQLLNQLAQLMRQLSTYSRAGGLSVNNEDL